MIGLEEDHSYCRDSIHNLHNLLGQEVVGRRKMVAEDIQDIQIAKELLQVLGSLHCQNLVLGNLSSHLKRQDIQY